MKSYGCCDHLEGFWKNLSSGQKLIKFEPDSVCPSFPNTLYDIEAKSIIQENMLCTFDKISFWLHISWVSLFFITLQIYHWDYPKKIKIIFYIVFLDNFKTHFVIQIREMCFFNLCKVTKLSWCRNLISEKTVIS